MNMRKLFFVKTMKKVGEIQWLGKEVVEFLIESSRWVKRLQKSPRQSHPLNFPMCEKVLMSTYIGIKGVDEFLVEEST